MGLCRPHWVLCRHPLGRDRVLRRAAHRRLLGPAVYNIAAAVELSRADGDQLVSHWPAAVLLAMTGTFYLSWVPFILLLIYQLY